jgi:hypothetical protein
MTLGIAVGAVGIGEKRKVADQTFEHIERRHDRITQQPFRHLDERDMDPRVCRHPSHQSGLCDTDLTSMSRIGPARQ